MANQKTHPSRVQGFESVREIGSDFVKAAGVKRSWDVAWNQILGLEDDSELKVTDPFTHKKNEVFNASNHKSKDVKHAEKAPAPVKKDAAIDHHGDFLRSSERASKQETREINQRLEQIMVELQRLVNSSKVLKMEFAGVTVDQAPEQAGEYHLNFFDWLLLTIRKARENVENAHTWRATSKKKGAKGKWNNKQRDDWFSNTSLSMGNESGGGYINQTG